jgi:C4-dicarboxylate-specific signal transduction histidine kinase
MLGELTASIAHEINQPLVAISASGQACLKWLERPAPEVVRLRKLMGDVVADAHRAAELISRIRGMAAGRPPERDLLYIDEVIREALLFIGHEAASRGVAISHLVAAAPQKVNGDRTQLQQVVVNLVINAMQAIVQAGSAERTVTIRTRLQDGSMCCSIEDSGPGIRVEDIPRLFDCFFTTKENGMGMGLRICRSVIEAHGGRIAADNCSSHGGARFHFTLPPASWS